jgi:hypothetical protein
MAKGNNRKRGNKEAKSFRDRQFFGWKTCVGHRPQKDKVDRSYRISSV